MAFKHKSAERTQAQVAFLVVLIVLSGGCHTSTNLAVTPGTFYVASTLSQRRSHVRDCLTRAAAKAGFTEVRSYEEAEVALCMDSYGKLWIQDHDQFTHPWQARLNMSSETLTIVASSLTSYLQSRNATSLSRVRASP